MEETKIPPPVNPLTVKINLWVLKLVFSNWAVKWLPTFDPVITSDYRTPAQNEAAGGAANSAHVHGLALDFALRSKATGKMVDQAQAKKVYEDFVAANWPGYSHWESASAREGYHIHVNLSRQITTYAGIVSLAGLGALGIAFLSGLEKKS